MWISLHFQDTDFIWPLSLDDKIRVFIDRTDGWQLNIADQCMAIPGSDFAVLHIVLSYFEMIGKFQDGFDQRGRSEHYFKKGVLSVFPNLRSYPSNVIDDLLDILYSGGRCGLYHGGMTDPHIFVSREPQIPIGYDPNNQRLIINVQQLVPALRAHLQEYGQQLRNPSNSELRRSFERRFDFETA